MSRHSALRALLGLASAALATWLARLDIPVVSALLTVALVAVALLFIPWFLWRVYRSFLWKVGRRLAFSYVLIGVLPIPMLALQLLVLAYLLSGFFLGHLYRDAARSLEADLRMAAEARVHDLEATGAAPARRDAARPAVGFGYYLDGRRVAGSSRLPAEWPAWLANRSPEADAGADKEAAASFVALPNGAPTLAAAAAVPGRAGSGVLAVYLGSLEEALSRRSDTWVRLYRPDEPGPDVVELRLGKLQLLIQRNGGRSAAEAEKFFKQGSQGEWRDQPLVLWGEMGGALFDLTTGERISEYVYVSLNGTPRAIQKHLFSVSADIDASAWGVLLILGLVLFWVYLLAVVMALFMIFGLSRAVNRLSRATAAVQSGDFAVRIPVRRRDQVGALQRSFNQMAANLETLVAAAAQKEILEKELAIARDLQTSLIPRHLPTGEGVEFATLFEPSAAIGGDYFDILRLSDRELAVIIADVSGHGLSTGLRMAMLKAALVILVEEAKDPEEILRRLDAVVRADEDGRFFVTATLAMVDFREGVLELTNAGHPPTYLLRGGRVEEILLPGSPLGGLGSTYGRTKLHLEDGDVVVWLSDGLIEVADLAGDPLGYDGVVQALAGPTGSATEVRDRLLAAVQRHAQGQPSADDRTLVVMSFRRPA